jgi:hypothetical protein
LLISMNVPARRPSVILEVAQLKTGMSVEQARRLGQQLIGIATEAEIQAFLLDWMTQHFGQLSVDQASALAVQFKQFMDQRRVPKPGGAGPAGGPGPNPNTGGPPPPTPRMDL